MIRSSPRFFRRGLLQVGGLSAVALALFWVSYGWDLRGLTETPWAHYANFDAELLPDATASLAGLIATVFGIVITVVSIIVQLSANRFTGVTRLFFTDRVHLTVMSYYIVVCVFGIWMSPALRSDHVPWTPLVVMLTLSTLGLAMMAPYFGYVFWFLEPINIISRIAKRAWDATMRGASHPSPARVFEAQARVLACLEELTDIASHSISDKDKIIASGAVDALKDFTIPYLLGKSMASDAWFMVGFEIRGNPDFVAMDPESLEELEERRTWVEWKVLRQYLGIYNEALTQMRDINYLIAIDTRYIGEAALAAKDAELVRLVLRFMNSYLRATLNARDVRTAYNVMNQYRLLVEAMLNAEEGELALESVGHMKYYGHVGFDQQQPFVTETVAYDVSTLCEIAHELGSAHQAALLKEFLDLDRPLPLQTQEKGLLGVRKAQVKLACYYLMHGERDEARRIADDMKDEPRERMQVIRQQLDTVRSKDFWEIIDRGRNFEYMPDEQRAQLGVFFRWFGQ